MRKIINSIHRTGMISKFSKNSHNQHQPFYPGPVFYNGHMQPGRKGNENNYRHRKSKVVCVLRQEIF